ncbi:MAG TPA: DUF4974 domain-containing protein [Butyricimonas virosa]|uniref:DUF4974 domain-containing protein n=1 Tax=Butyricimonas virosa TaxID=544645 RepID=A0A921L050_9BACT|nr:DUF4974 domain-containing protein [Butyricimonas virosa]
MDYNKQDIEFAFTILNHREMLNDEEVAEWLKDPAHLALMTDITVIKQKLSGRDYKKIKKEVGLHIKQDIRIARNRRLITYWSSGVAAMLIVGLFTYYGINFPRTSDAYKVKTELTLITPGRPQARLILPDGNVKELDNLTRTIETRFIEGVKNDSLSGLSYSQVKINAHNLPATEIYNTLVVPTGGFYPLELSDGTQVWINSESELHFPVKFLSEKREVFLKGEAFFIVKKDSTKPFIVNINSASIEVLGTTFNVNTYADNQCIYTTLVNGSIKFISNKNKQEVILEPGTQSVTDTVTGNTSIREVDVKKYISWREGRFIFDGMSLELIMCQLQRWYNIDVFYQNPTIKKHKFRGVINKDMSLEKVLDMISEATNIKFNVKNRTITIYK